MIKPSRRYQIKLLWYAYLTALAMVMVINSVEYLMDDNPYHTLFTAIYETLFLWNVVVIFPLLPISAPYFAILLFISLKFNHLKWLNSNQFVCLKFVLLTLGCFKWHLFVKMMIEAWGGI